MHLFHFVTNSQAITHFTPQNVTYNIPNSGIFSSMCHVLVKSLIKYLQRESESGGKIFQSGVWQCSVSDVHHWPSPDVSSVCLHSLHVSADCLHNDSDSRRLLVSPSGGHIETWDSTYCLWTETGAEELRTHTGVMERQQCDSWQVDTGSSSINTALESLENCLRYPEK